MFTTSHICLINAQEKMMEINELETFEDLRSFLLERMDFADDTASKANPAFTRKGIWNFYMDQCFTYGDEKLPVKSGMILKKNIKKDFNQRINTAEAQA